MSFQKSHLDSNDLDGCPVFVLSHPGCSDSLVFAAETDAAGDKWMAALADATKLETTDDNKLNDEQ